MCHGMMEYLFNELHTYMYRYMYVLIILQNMCHLELQVGGTCNERGATGTVWNLKLNTSYLGDALVWQREHLRITSFLVYNLLDYVARTRTSITRRPILVVTQRVATSMTLTTLVIKPYGAYEPWLREQKGVVELSGCMDTTVGTGMFM